MKLFQLSSGQSFYSVEMDMYFLTCTCEDAVELSLLRWILNLLDIIWSLKTQSSLLEISDVLLMYCLLFFSFLGKATSSLLIKKKTGLVSH